MALCSAGHHEYVIPLWAVADSSPIVGESGIGSYMCPISTREELGSLYAELHHFTSFSEIV